MLDENKIKEDIAQAFTRVMHEAGNDRQGAIDRVAAQLARSVAEAIRSAEVVYSSGLVAPAGGGAVTGKFEGSLK